MCVCACMHMIEYYWFLKPVFIQGLRRSLQRNDAMYLRVRAVYSCRSVQCRQTFLTAIISIMYTHSTTVL